MDLKDLTHEIIGAAIEVHRELGPGLLESVYHECLRVELEMHALKTATEVRLPVTYKGKEVSPEGFRLDLLVEGEVVVELKSVEHIKPVHKKQLLTYLRLADKRVGLLMNFNEAALRDGIVRIVNGLER